MTNSTNAVAYTIDGAIYCAACFNPRFVQAEPVFAGEEFDQAPTCDSCGETIDEVTVISEYCIAHDIPLVHGKCPSCDELDNPDEDVEDDDWRDRLDYDET